MKQNSIVPHIVFGLILLLFAFVALSPFVLMVLTSLTDKVSINFSFKNTEFHIKNYIRIFNNFNLGRNFLNSTMIAASACILSCLISSMAAFGFAKKRFPCRNKIFMFYLASLMIPAQVTLIPYFVIIQKLGLINNYLALILPIDAFGVFLIRQFMLKLPDDLLESAVIDGCNEVQLFTFVVIPLIKAALISLTIFTFLALWNDFLRPLVVMTRNEMKTLTVAIAVLKGNSITNYGLMTAGTSLAFLPMIVFYIILQRQFVEGISLSGIKG